MTTNSISQYRGIFGIPATPFNEDETLDVRSLESVLNFSVENGCHGIVMPVMASEYQSLTDEERKTIFEITARVVDGRKPTVAGVTGVSNIHSIELARHAQELGFDSVIAMPPHNIKPSTEEVQTFFEQLSDALEIPIWIQNHSAGAPLTAIQLVELCQNIENVSYVKEETVFAGQLTTSLFKQDGDASEVEFHVDFELKNKILNVLMIKSFDLGLKKIADAFEKRAIDLFKST